MTMTKFYIGARLWPGISKLVEECGEVGQVCGKIIGTAGLDFRAVLQDKIADALAVIDYVIARCNLDGALIADRAAARGATLHRWHREQIERDGATEPAARAGAR